MPRPSDWNVLGLHGDPTPGDPVQIRLLVDDLVKIGTQARSIAQAIDQVMNTADSSVFAGKTADALRGKVDERLRNHIHDVADSFWEVSQNLSAWANHIEDAQRQADGALSAARGLAKDDPQVEVHRQTAQNAGTHLADVGNTTANAIRNASDIRLPISDCQVFWEMFQILAIILIVPALIFGGPVALLALGVNMTLFVKAAIDFARGDIGFLDLFLAGLGIIAPTTKALPIFAIGGLLKSGFKAVLQWGRNGFLSLKDLVNGFRFATVFTSLRDVARISLSWVREGGLWVMQNFHNVPALAGSVFVKGGLVVVQGVRSIPVVVRGWGSAVRAGAPGAWQNFRIFAQETWSSQMAGGKWTRLILPVTHTDIAEHGLKGALRMGFWDRGVMGRGVWDLPVGGTIAHTASAVPMGPHGATPHLDLGHTGINMARMDLENVRFGNFADTHTSVRPSSFSVAPVSTVDLTGLRVGTVNPVAVHGANAVFDNSTAGFRAVRHMDDVVDIAGTQMSRMRIDAMDAAPGQMSGGLGVSAAAPGGHVTHSSGLYVPGSAGTPVVHEGVDVAALVAKGNGGNLLAQGPTGVLTAPPGGTGAVHTALTGVPAPAPGATGLHDLLAAPGAPGAGTGAAHTALSGVPAPPSGAGVHDLLAAPGGTGGAHGPLTGVPGHQSGTGAAGGSAFDLLSGGAKGTPNNPVPAHIGSDLGDNVAGAARANQAHMALDEIVRPAGSGRPGSVATDAVPGSTTHGVPAPGLPKGGVHGTPPKDAARSALDLLDDGRGVRPVDGPAFAGAPGTGKAVDADTGHAFAGAPARSTDDVVATPGTHGKAPVTGDGHVAVPLRQDPAPAPATGSGGGRVHSHQAELFHEVNLKLGKMGSGAVTVETVTAARQVLEDLRGAAFTKVDIRAQADQLAVHLAGPERGHLPGGVRDSDLTHDAPTSPGPGGHHAPPVPPRPPRPESGLLDGLDDVDLDATGAPLGSRFDFDDDSVPGTPVSEHGTEDLDGFSEFVDLIRPLRQHVEQAIDNPAANIEVALVASPGGRTWREFSDDVGHAMVAVMLPGERKPLTIGFYPEEGHLFGNPGAIVNDAEYLVSGHVRVLGTYRITAAQLFDGYRYAMANSGAVYDLFRYNCVRFAEGFVSAALGKSVADLWVAAPYRLVDTMLRRDGAWHWADGTSPVAKLTADDTIRYQDAFGEVEDWRRVDPDGVQGATDQAKTFVLFDHQRPLIDGNVKTVPQRERLEILEQFEKMITHTILNSGDDAGRQLSRQLGETYGTLRPGLSDLPGPSVTVPAADGSLSGIGRGSVDSVPEPVPSPVGSAAGDSAGHLPPSSVHYPSDVQHMFGEIDDMLQDMGLFRTSLDDLPSGPPSPVHPGTGGGDVHVGTGGGDVARFMDDTRPVRQHLEHAIADPAADIRLVLGTDGSTGARSLTVLLPGRDAPVPLGPGAPGELGAVRGTADGAPAGGTHVLEEHRITAAQLENAYLYAARNLPLWHTDAGRFTDGFMNAVLDARPAVPDGSAGRAVRDVTADVTDAPPVVGDKGKGKPPGGTLDTTGTGSDHGGVRGNFADDLSEIDASAAITDARRELINARTIRDDLQTRYVDGVGTSAEVDGVRYLESWQQVRQADAALAQAEAHWNDLTGGAPLPEVQSYTGHGLGGGAPRLPDGLRSLLRLKGRGDAVPPAPEGIVQSVDHVPSATHVVTPLEGGKFSHALVPSGQDLTVAHWLSEPQSAHGWPKGQGKEAYEGDLNAHQEILTKGLARAEHDDALKSVLLQQQKSFDENTRLFQALEGRTELRDLRMPQLAAIVMAERRALRTLAADTDLLTTKLRSDEWEWAKGYRLDGAEAGELITKVHKHLQDELSLTVNLKLGNQLPGGGTLLDAMTADQQLLRNAWEIDNAGAGYYVTRGNTEEALGLPASVKRTTDASGIYPGQGGKAFAPTAADLADLPNYAALTSKYRPSGVKMYGQAVFHLKPNLMERATFTPADSFGQGLEGALSVTGRGNMLPLLNHGPEVLVRLAFAEATDFQYDSAFRGLRDAGKLEGKLNRYFEAQLHGGVKWDDLDRVVLVNDGFNPAGLQAQKLQLEQFAKDKGLSFTVEVHNARPGAATSAPGVHPAPPAPPGSGGAHPGGTGGGPGPSPAHAPGPVSGHPGGPDTPPAPGGSKSVGAADEVHDNYEDLRFTASLLDESGAPRADLFTGTALRVERSGDASFVSPAAPSASAGSAKLTDDQILNVAVGTGGRNGDERRTLGGFEFGAGTRSNDGKNLVSRPIVVTVKDGGTEAEVAVHLNVMLSSGNEADVTVAGKKLANTTEVTITGSKYHLTARPHTDQNLIDLHGPSSDTASKSIHVGPSNAKSGWNSRPGNTRNLAQALGVSEQKLIEALDNRFPPSGLVDTIHRFQDDVERAVVHGSGAEDVRVHFQGDKSFPVRGDSNGVSPRGVSVPAGVVDDVLHGSVPGAGRVDLTLDPGWDAARGAAVPNTVKHSWVDPVSTPRGGGAHAPRYEVRAGYDVRRFELGDRSVTDLTVRVRLADEGLAPSEVDALWDRAVSGVERVFNRPGETLRDGSVLHVTLERVAGNAADAHLNVRVGRPQGAMNQHQWRVDATEQDLAHELGHQLGLRDEYRDTTAGHRPEVDGSLMGNYHNAAPEGLSQGGLRGRYLDLIHSQVASHDHVHVPQLTAASDDVIAPGGGTAERDLLDPAVFKTQTSGSGSAIDAVERRMAELHDVHGTDLAGRITALDELTAAADDFLTAHRGAPGAAGVERVLVQARAESGAYRLLQEHGAFGTGHGGGVAALDDLTTRVRAVLAGDDLTQATRLRLQDALTEAERQAGALRLLAGNDVPATPAPAPAAAGRGTDDVPWAEDYRRVEELLGREGDPRREGWGDLTRARQDLGSAEDALPHGEASTSQGLSTIEEQLRSDTLAARDRVTSAIDGLRDQGIDPHQIENRIRGFNERAAVDRGATPGAGRLSEVLGNPEGSVTRVELSDSGIEGNNGLVIERVEAGDGSVSHRLLGRGLELDEGRTVAFRDGGFDVRHTASDTVVRYNESGVRTAQEVPLRNAAEVPNGLRLHTDLNGRGRPVAVRLTGPDAEHHLAEPLEDGAVRVTDIRTGGTTRFRTSGRPIDEGLRLRGADGAPAEGDLVLVREDGTTRVTDVQGRDVPRTVTPLGGGAGFRITDDVSGASVRHDGAGRLQESGVSLTRADGGRGDLFLARDGAGTHTLTNALGVPQRGDVSALPGGAGFRVIDDGTGATSRYTPDGRWQDAGTALADPADGTRGARVAVADGSGGLRLTDGLGNPLTERVTDVGGGRLRTIDGTTGRTVLHDAQARPVETGTALADPATGRGARFVVPDAAGGHRLTDATGAALPERVQALPGDGGFRVTHATGYRTFAADGAFTGDGLRLTGRGGEPVGHLDQAAGGGPRWLDDTFAPDPQRAVTVHGNGHIEIARPGGGHQVFHGTTGELVQEVTPLPGGGHQVTAAHGSFARHDAAGVLTAHGTPLPDGAGGGVLVTRAPSADAPNGAHWLEDPAGNRLRHWNATGQPTGGVRIECTLPGGPRRGEFLELDPNGVVVRQGFNVLDKGRTTPYQYVLDHRSGTWARTGGPDGAPRGVFHHGKADLTGAANGRVVLLSATGAPVPVFERRVLPGGGFLDSFRRTDSIAFGRTNPRTSWARWGDDATLSGAGIREYDTAGTGWRDFHGRNVVHEYQAGLQKHANGTGHTLALRNGNGELRWHRYDGAGEELAEGPRIPDRFDSGWTDLADDGRTLVQRKWGMGRLPEHAGQYEEHRLVQDAGAPGGWRTDGTWQRQSPHGKEVGKAEVVDGHLLVTERWREQRPPVWVRNGLLPGAGRAEGAYAHVLGDNAHQLFTWEKRPIGTATGEGTSGVRYVGLDGGILDLTANGDFARLTTKLHDGTTIKVGDHAGRPAYEPAAAAHQPWEAGQSRGYRVPQDPAATGLLWTDEFRDATGARHVAREGLPGGVVREYTTPRAVDTPAGHGTWVTRDAHGNLTGMRQPNPDGAANSFIEGVGRADSAKWTWREVNAEGAPLGSSGTREFFRGSNDPRLSWDDSFRDLDADRRLVRERRMLDKGRYVEAWRDPDHDTRWLTAAYERTGNRIDPGPGLQVRSWWNGTSWQDQWSRGARHFRDELRPLPDTEGATVRLREVPVGLGGPLRVREYDPAAATPHSVWKEFDHESVVRERKAERGADGTVTGYLETDAWRGQWNRYDADGGLVAQRTDSGLVWERGPLGQMRLVGNEYDYRGALTEIRGWGRRIREAQRMPWSGTVVPDGAGAALREARYEPYWRTLAYKAAVEFGQEFVLEFGANLAVNGIVAAAQDKPFTGKDVLKAFANAAVSSGVKTGVGVAVHENRAAGFRELGNLKTTLANVDGGKHPQRRPFNHDKTWTNEWAGNETPTRWRGGIYDFTFSAGTSVISGWVNGAMNAAVWGVSNADGTTVKLSGADAFLDGGINAAAALTTSASTALVKNVVVLGGGSRLFHRQGFADFWIQLPFKIFEKSIQSVYLTGAYRASINPSWYQVPPAGTQQKQ
ncbi:hypothetical protein ACFYWP_33765 [Actinacidiphila glaucinigra]|uniref:hypothetical protein n=1 Tax=Actinacidiphila glaucinigra TaxID=235986 RepID=UPI0036756B18